MMKINNYIQMDSSLNKGIGDIIESIIIDKTIVNLIIKINKKIKTIASCSGVYKEHIGNEKITGYITFKDIWFHKIRKRRIKKIAKIMNLEFIDKQKIVNNKGQKIVKHKAYSIYMPNVEDDILISLWEKFEKEYK